MYSSSEISEILQWRKKDNISFFFLNKFITVHFNVGILLTFITIFFFFKMICMNCFCSSSSSEIKTEIWDQITREEYTAFSCYLNFLRNFIVFATDAVTLGWSDTVKQMTTQPLKNNMWCNEMRVLSQWNGCLIIMKWLMPCQKHVSNLQNSGDNFGWRN